LVLAGLKLGCNATSEPVLHTVIMLWWLAAAGAAAAAAGSGFEVSGAADESAAVEVIWEARVSSFDVPC
jgi:anti-sigma factor RsiW